MKYANTGDLEELQHGLDKIHHEPKSQHQQKSRGSNKTDKASGDRDQEVNYSSTLKVNSHDANMAQMYQGCRVCGQNVIHLDGKCNAVIQSGIRDSSYRPQANVAQGVNENHSVLFEDNDRRGSNLFHLPVKVTSNVFDDLDDDI